MNIPPAAKAAANFLLPPITTEAAPGGQGRLEKQDIHAVLDEAKMRISRAAGDSATQHRIIADVLDQAKAQGLNVGWLNGQLQKAAAVAGNTRRAAGLERAAERKLGLPDS